VAIITATNTLSVLQDLPTIGPFAGFTAELVRSGNDILVRFAGPPMLVPPPVVNNPLLSLSHIFLVSQHKHQHRLPLLLQR